MHQAYSDVRSAEATRLRCSPDTDGGQTQFSVAQAICGRCKAVQQFNANDLEASIEAVLETPGQLTIDATDLKTTGETC